MDVALQGGCLCGGVRFAYRGPLGGDLGAVTVCHCATCLKAQGGPVAVAPGLASGFSLAQGQALVREFSSSPGKYRAFCGGCGSPLYSRRDDRPQAIRLRLGALEQVPAEIRVQAHIHAGHGPAWDETQDQAPRFAEVEPGRA